jgi:hypothetical protein
LIDRDIRPSGFQVVDGSRLIQVDEHHPALLLTHTNSGVAALRVRLQRANVPAKRYAVHTIDGLGGCALGGHERDGLPTVCAPFAYVERLLGPLTRHDPTKLTYLQTALSKIGEDVDQLELIFPPRPDT